ncbi:MAG: FecR family protein [Nevskiales bacterium]
MSKRFAFILALSLSVLPGMALAADGRVLFVSGDASIERGGQKSPALKGQLIQTGDVLVTGAGARLQWRMADDSFYALRQNSRFEIKEYTATKGTNGGGTALYNLLRGGVRVLSGLIGKGNPDAFKLNTPVATLGIRGTDFTTIACSGDCTGPGGAAVADGAYVKVDEGGADATNGDGTAGANKGEYIMVNSPPQTATTMPAVFYSWKADFQFMFDPLSLGLEDLRIESDFNIRIEAPSTSPN